MALIFDRATGRYRDGDRLLTREEVRAEMEKITRHVERQSRILANRLINKRISLVEWQISMRELVKASHVLGGALGYGGFAQMTSARWGTIGAELRRQYRYLNRFARHIEQGRVILESQIANRAQLYAKSIRTVYYLGETAVAKLSGIGESRRILHALESCTQCLAWSRRGFVPIDDQPPVGKLICGQYCRCTFEYR
jgi:hypothetical protein